MRVLMFAAAVVWGVALLGQAPHAAQAQKPAAFVHESIGFDTSDNCQACHNSLTTADGEDVSIGISWRASIMAHSSRDPYWQASVRRETLDHPLNRQAIEDECAICHMPMARAAAHAAGRETEVFRLAPSAGGDSKEHRLAADGVSCTLCHQITPERFGTRESFVGGFVIAPDGGSGRTMFGPYRVDEGRTRIMRSSSGAAPDQGEHVRQSELCATCHTLYTEALDDKGQVIGSLPEQMPYLEWFHSSWRNERSCQECHMPEAQSTRVSSVFGEVRDRLARHTFLGGNFFMLRMLNRYRADLGVVAPSHELDASARATLRQLETDTASLALENLAVSGGQLQADVVARNLTGHKLPTGYPSRRAWLHLSVRDNAGAIVFESGAVMESGAIRGNDNDADPQRFEPHYRQIDRPDQVQIYESVMSDAAGKVTTGLLHGTQFLKDNRLLPRGFDKASAGPDIAVRGEAASDEDFTGNGDRVRYAVPVGAASGPFRVEVELRYQPIGFRWADNLRGYDAAEPRRFVGYFESMAPASSAVLARASAVVLP